jgi:membrane associated rhomboid family serine protease
VSSLFSEFFQGLALRVGGVGRALLIVLLWIALCLTLLLIGAAIGLTDPKDPGAGIMAAVFGVLGALLLVFGPWIAEAMYRRHH